MGMELERGKKTWQLLVSCLPMLKGYVRRLADSEEQANEIFQEVSLRMLTTEGPDDPERYGAWARGVVRHVIAHDWRMRRRARAEQPFEEELVEEFVQPPADPEAHLDARAWVARIVGDLDSEGVELLYRRYVLQESGKELADDLARSPASVRMRLMRLRSSASVLARTARDGLAVAATLGLGGARLSADVAAGAG
jgi:RNA polymerase sigma factor (sigma-70 family)